jgi:hypothetical protein
LKKSLGERVTKCVMWFEIPCELRIASQANQWIRRQQNHLIG